MPRPGSARNGLRLTCDGPARDRSAGCASASAPTPDPVGLMFDPQPDDQHRSGPPGAQPSVGGGAIDRALATEPAADLGRVRAVIDALSGGGLRDGVGRRAAARPTPRPTGCSRASRSSIGPISCRGSRRSDPGGRGPGRIRPSTIRARHVTVRPRDQPNRWFALRTVPLEQRRSRVRPVRLRAGIRQRDLGAHRSDGVRPARRHR